MGSSVGGFLRILFMLSGFFVFLLVVAVALSSNSNGVQARYSSITPPTKARSSNFNKASLEVVRGEVAKEIDASIHHHSAAAAGGSDPNYNMSKRKVPNGPDPIHNRRTGNSGTPPGRA